MSEKFENFLKKIKKFSEAPKSMAPKRKKMFKIIFWLAIIALFAIFIFYFHHKNLKNNPDVATQEEVNQVVAQVSKIMDLPQGETPTLATINDITKLKDQTFFRDAQNGDKILVYANAKEAIIYRPGVNRIINVAPLIIEQPNSNQPVFTSNPPNQVSAFPSPIHDQSAPVNGTPNQVVINNSSNNFQTSNSLNVIICNGTKTTGLAGDTAKKLSGINGVIVIGTKDANKNDYTDTVVVDITRKNLSLVNQIAQAVGGRIGDLPNGETISDGADVLIIVGTSK